MEKRLESVLFSFHLGVKKESIQSSLPHGAAPTLQVLLPLLVLMYWARPSFLLCYEESPAGFALVCECYLFYSLLNGWWTKGSVWAWTIWDFLILRGCLRFSLSSPVRTFERSLTTRKCWLWLRVLVSAFLIHLVRFEDRTVGMYFTFFLPLHTMWWMETYFDWTLSLD